MALQFDWSKKKQLYPNSWNPQSDPLAALKTTATDTTAPNAAWNPKTAGQGFTAQGAETPPAPVKVFNPPTTDTGAAANQAGTTGTVQTPTGASDTGGTGTYDYGNYLNYNQTKWTDYIASSRTNFLNVLQSKGGLSADYGNAIADWMLANNLAAPSAEQLKSILSANSNFSFNGTDEQFRMSFQQALDVATDWSKELGEKQSEYGVSTSGDQYTDTIDWLVKNFETGWDNTSVVEPFESEWTSIFGDAFKNLAGSSSSTDFLQNFLKGFGIDKIATGQVNWGDYGFKDYSPDALLKFLEDGSNIPSWDSKTVEGADVKDEQSFIKFIMDAAKTMLPQLDSDVSLMSDILGGARSEQMRAALQLINQPGMTKEEYETQVSGIMDPIKQAADSQKRQAEAQAGMVLAGDSTKSLYAKRQIDNNTSVQEASVRGSLTATDLKMRQENMQYAIATMGSITQSEIDRLKEAANIQGTKNGQVLDFLAKVGQIAVGSKETEYTAYTDRLNAAQQLYLTNADRTLKEKLGIAGINLDLYKTETGLDYDKVQLAYETALKNRGINSTEATAQAQSMIEQYKMAATFAQMDQDKLTKLAQLAAQGQAGDREAWGAYQSMILEENLKNRGMDITQAQSLAELTFGMWKTDKETALQMWATKYNAQLQKELAQMEIDSKPSPWLSAVGSLFGGIGSILPFLKSTPKPAATNV